jgi:beta-lactamase superfamily II metal-dependent hydrolase
MAQFSRREFFRKTGLALAATVVSSKMTATVSEKELQKLVGKKSGFTMWQLNTQCNQIGNSYIFVTDKGRVIVMDGGFQSDEYYLRGFLAMLGNKVDTWFISHPHQDHMGSLMGILKEPRGIQIKRIIHSRFNEALINSENYCAKLCREFYEQLDKLSDTEVIDLTEPGREESIDGFNYKILGVSNPELLMNGYNNSSVIIRVWDRQKTILFLGDAGIECGNKLLNGPYRSLLDCDYMQMAHHGQNGCDEHFYKTVNFKACLWSTPQWVWENNAGKGINTHILKTFDTRRWMDEKGIKEHHVSWKGLWQLD